MRSETQSDWKTNIEKVIDTFMSKINEYPIVECEALLSVLEGGEYQGLGYGVHGITKDNSKFTAVGLFKDIESSQKEYKMNNEFETTSDKLLAIYYDERHPERNDMFLATPEEVTLIPTLSNKFSNFLMNSARLNQFISALQLDQTPDFNNTEMVAKRCLGLKILNQHLSHNGKQINDCLDEATKTTLINTLLTTGVKPLIDEPFMRLDWYEQRIFAIKRLATESDQILTPDEQTDKSVQEETKEENKEDAKDDKKEQTTKDNKEESKEETKEGNTSAIELQRRS